MSPRALEAAMQCFWRHGYEATSLRDLTGAMGLTAPSLYNSFGDKQQLFGRALEHIWTGPRATGCTVLSRRFRRARRSSASLPKSSNILSKTGSVRAASLSIRH